MKHNGFNKGWDLGGGFMRPPRRAREQGLPVRFIGKNFVFDERMGERIPMTSSRTVISVARRAIPIPIA